MDLKKKVKKEVSKVNESIFRRKSYKFLYKFFCNAIFLLALKVGCKVFFTYIQYPWSLQGAMAHLAAQIQLYSQQ